MIYLINLSFFLLFSKVGLNEIYIYIYIKEIKLFEIHS